MIWVYNILLTALFILGLPVLILYSVLSAKRRPVVLRRLGVVLPQPARRRSPHSSNPIWIHALSVGEVMATVPLITALQSRYGKRPIVLSASTLAGHGIALEKLGHLVDAVFLFPYDLPFSVKRIVARIRPAMVIMLETDIWPNFLFEMQRRGVPVALANAKLSLRSLAGYRRIGAFSRPVFACFSALCCQSREDAARFSRLGISETILSVTGNLKFDQSETPLSESDVTALRETLGIERRHLVWVAGSTHEGEEALIQQAFSAIRRETPHLILVIAPRNPERAAAVCRIFSAARLEVVTLSAMTQRVPPASVDVVVVDALGILSRLYALADVTLIGGSLIQIKGIGGHNPLEPAAFAKPILFGHHMHNFREIARMLIEADGAIGVADACALQAAVAYLVKDRHRGRQMGQNARRVFDANKGAVSKTVAILADLLPP
jgi:3-deoxy-D-manno-octulosonic-acid transferase